MWDLTAERKEKKGGTTSLHFASIFPALPLHFAPGWWSGGVGTSPFVGGHACATCPMHVYVFPNRQTPHPYQLSILCINILPSGWDSYKLIYTTPPAHTPHTTSHAHGGISPGEPLLHKKKIMEAPFIFLGGDMPPNFLCPKGWRPPHESLPCLLSSSQTFLLLGTFSLGRQLSKLWEERRGMFPSEWQ